MTLNVNPKTKQELRAYVSKTLTETFGKLSEVVEEALDDFPKTFMMIL
jgi:hypothetical protein